MELSEKLKKTEILEWRDKFERNVTFQLFLGVWLYKYYS